MRRYLKLFAMSNADTPDKIDIYKEKKLVATIGCCCIIFLSILGVLMTLAVMQAQTHNAGIVALANNQIEVWREIERTISYTVVTNPDKSIDLELVKNIQERMKSGYEKSEKISNTIRQTFINIPFYGRLFSPGQDLGEIINLSNVDARILDGVKRISAYPPELVSMGIATWDADLQILFRSGQYLAPLKKLANIARPFVKQQQKTASIIIIAINSVLILSVVGIWGKTLLPAFDTLSAQHLSSLRARDHLEREHAKFSTALHSMSEAVCMVDSKGQIISANSQFRKLFDLESKGRTIDNLLELLKLSFKKDILKKAKFNLSTLKKRLHNKMTLLANDRTVLWRFSQADSDTWLVMISDKTQLIQEQGRALHDERLLTLGQIAGGVAHDFNNILASILGRVELLLAMGDLNSNQDKQLHFLHVQCQRGGSLTSQLLSYSGCQPLQLSEVKSLDLKPLIEQQLDLPQNIKLTVNCLSSSRLNLDTHFFTNSMVNVVNNASEAIGNEKGTINILIEDKKLRRNGEEKKHVAITVSDNGGGFTKESLDKACEPFYSTKHKQNGTGLGLSMVQGFVNQSGGKLSVTNTDIGAKVSLYFLAA